MEFPRLVLLPLGLGSLRTGLVLIAQGQAAVPPPNIVVIVADDLGYVPANASGPASGAGSGANPSDARFAESRIPQAQLFNLRTDPAETKNVIAAFPEKAAELQQRLTTITARRGPAASP